MPVIAITRHSPEQVYAWLKSKRKNPQITFVPLGGFLDPSKKYRKNIFIVGTREFDRNVVAIRNMPLYNVFVFGHTESLERYGLEVDRELGTVAPIKPKAVPIGSYLDDLIAQSIEGSLFHELMTYIYKLPSKTHQKPITSIICHWIYEGGTEMELEANFDKLSIRITAAHRENLLRILRKPVCSRLRAAFRDLRLGMCETMGQAVVKHRVQIFELGYIKGNVEKVDNATDKYVGNQGV
ncbi:hypothetical protein fHeYen902_094c [Yersinia phage fHe-Yen9-02]|nr:hypothetical protein fHeYen902_094c [Yersinia phage fHe-Yen9-02]